MLEFLNENEFDKVYYIMENSFPTDEIRPYNEQKALLKNECYRVYVWKEDESIIAFVAVWEFENLLFIEHFAVDKKYRNNGIGSKILKAVVKLTDKQICLEVEPCECELTKRRVEFYKRNGFFLNDYYYVQPVISKGKKTVTLKIMTFGNFISLKIFNDIKYTLYKNVYKISL